MASIIVSGRWFNHKKQFTNDGLTFLGLAMFSMDALANNTVQVINIHLSLFDVYIERIFDVSNSAFLALGALMFSTIASPDALS